MNSRLLGLILFLLILFSLYLFLYYPFGIKVSFAIGIGILIVLRFISPRFMKWSAKERCLWCQKKLSDVIEININLKKKEKTFRVCSKICRDKLRSFSNYAQKYQKPIAIGIFLPFFFYLITMLLHAYGYSVILIPINQAIFRGVIGLTILIAAFLYIFSSGSDESPSFSFSIHSFTLLGMKGSLLTSGLIGIILLYQAISFFVTKLRVY